MAEKTILHIDMNSCYASIECLHQPKIRHLPVAVGGDLEARHGIILAKNEHAKKFGIKTGETLWQAKQKCPRLVIVPPRYDLYLRFSRLAREIYADYTDQIEPFGIDEAWIDVSGSTHLFGEGQRIADEIRKRVKFELGITVSVGVSYNKIFSKLASDYRKPDATTVFTKEDYRQKVWCLPVEDLLYVGRATQKKLNERSIKTIGQLANTDPSILRTWLGKAGEILWTFANGYDTTPVARAGDETIIKSVGHSTTTPRDLVDEQDASIIYYMLAEAVAERIREGGFLARTVQISLRDNDLFSFERQVKLSNLTCLSSELHDTAMELLRKNYKWGKPLRSIGIRAADLVPASSPQQLTLLEDGVQRERQERLERTVDSLRRRFGYHSICRAVCTMDKTLNNIDAKGEHIIHPVGYFKAL